MSGHQVAERRVRYSANELPTPRRTSLVVRFLRQFTDMFAVLLIAAPAISFLAARIKDDENAWLFDARWGVDVAVPSAAPLISLVEEAADVTDTVSLLRLVKAGVNIIETVIGPESKAADLQVGAVPLPAGSVVAAVIRAGRPVVLDPSYELRVGDEWIIVTQAASEREIDNAFQ